MKTAVIYYSLGGSTRSFARAEATARAADLIEIRPAKPYNPFTSFILGCPAAIRQKAVPLADAPNLSGYDHFVLMAPVWAGHPAPPFNSAVQALPAGAKVEVLLVSASGTNKSRAKVRALSEGRGCTVTALRDIQSHQ